MCLVEINTSLKLVVSCAMPMQNIYFFLGWLRRALKQSQPQFKSKNLFNNRLNLKRNYTPYGKFNYKHEDVIKFLKSQFENNFKNRYKDSELKERSKEYELTFKKEYKEFKTFLQADSAHEKFYDAELIEISENEKIVILKAYNLSKDTNSIYFLGEENKKIELLNIFSNTGAKDSISEIGIRLEVKLEDFEKIVSPSDLEKLKEWRINKEEMEEALKEIKKIVNNIENRRIYNLNKGGKIENINSDFKGDEVITTE